MRQIKLWAKNYGDISLVVLLAIVLRLKDLLTFDLWFDEAFTGILMRVPKTEFANRLNADAHPPLFNLLVKYFTNTFGVNDFTLRFLPFVFGIATVYIIYIATKKIFDHETGVIASFLAAVSPIFVAYSIEARSYSFYVFVTVLAYYFLVAKKYLLFVLTLLLLTQTHYIAPLFIASLMLIYFLSNLKDKKTLLKGIAFFSPIVLIIWNQISESLATKIEGLNTAWIQKAGIANIISSFVAYFFGIKTKISGITPLNELDFLFLDEIFWGSLFVSIFIVGSVYALIKRKNINLAFLLLALLIPHIGLIFAGTLFDANIYVERYVLPSAIFFIIAVAYLLKNLTSFEIRILSIIFYVILLTKISAPYYDTGMKMLAKSFSDFKQEIVFTTPSEYTIARYYFGENFTNLRLQNPKDPNNTYNHWPFIKGDLRPQNPQTAVFISPDQNRLGKDFTQTIVQKDFGSYRLYTLK